jgi:hypothetical protein
VIDTAGESSDFTRRAASAASTVAWLTSASWLLLEFLAAEGLDDAHRFEALLDDCDDVALVAADLVRRRFHLLVEARDEEQQEGGGANGDQREVPVEPEHDADHAEDGQQVDDDGQRSRRGEALDRLDVGGQRGQDGAGLVGVVVTERQPVQVVVDAHAQVVRDPLADALGIVVVDIARQRAEQCDDDDGGAGHRGKFHLVAAEIEEAQRVEPSGRLVATDDVVEDDLERPG